MITILFVHQSASLYGSDKVLLWLVAGLNKNIFRPIVFIPQEGPLSGALAREGIETHVVPLVKIGRKMFNVRGLLSLPWKTAYSLYCMNRTLKGLPVDIVHSNTLAVLSGAVWAWVKSIPHLWHVHEIVVHPRAVKRALPWISGVFSDRIITNSKATLEWLLNADPELSAKSSYIWNGIERRPDKNPEANARLREELGLSSDDILVTLAGRLNRWKGQELLLKAAELLTNEEVSNVHFLMIGSAPEGQSSFKNDLVKRISASPLTRHVHLMDFRDDMWTIWDATDIAVVPSTEPEPFGLVAVEAMASEKPVIAAAHGGLKEIVVDGETGLLFENGNAPDLARCIARLASNRLLRMNMGTCGKRRQERYFTLTDHVRYFEAAYLSMKGTT